MSIRTYVARKFSNPRKYKISTLEKYQYKSRKIIWAPSIRNILIALNLHMDYIILTIDGERYRHDEGRFELFDFEQISEIEWSVLLLEDRRYLVHSGLDLIRSISRQIKRAILFRGLGGMSTIEQQLVRTILDDRRRTISRKFREMLLANALSYRKTKFDILRTYLKIAYFGYRIKGADQASNLLFGKSIINLSDSESDFIASLLVYPLPKTLSEAAYVAGTYKITDTDYYFESAKDIEPRWAARMKRRMLYAALLRRHSIKPLYEIH